jgi:hypothetical protein
MKLFSQFVQRFSACANRKSSSSEPVRPKRQRNSESGFALLFALAVMGVMLVLTATVLEIGATQARRAREEETIWRGKQYVRAIRLYYHKTGRYPQTLDDLTKGLPELHFLRQAYKNPMDPAEGAWRFVYVNQAGQIIGSTRYATLQQMALLDLNGGVLPGTQQIPGQPGIPVSSLSNSGGNSDPSQTPAQNPGTGGVPGSGAPPSGPGGPDSNPPGGQPPSQDPSQTNPGQPTPPAGANPGGSAFGGAGGILGGQAPTSTTSLQTSALGQTNVAALAQLKPTGPVDGPVLGAFLTGVACIGDRKSQKVYHGGKKYIEWEFIWNPLEDAAAAQQQQATSGQGGILGGTLPGATGAAGGTTNPGGSTNFGGTGNSGSSFGPGSGGQQPSQPQNPQQ